MRNSVTNLQTINTPSIMKKLLFIPIIAIMAITSCNVKSTHDNEAHDTIDPESLMTLVDTASNEYKQVLMKIDDYTYLTHQSDSFVRAQYDLCLLTILLREEAPYPLWHNRIDSILTHNKYFAHIGSDSALSLIETVIIPENIRLGNGCNIARAQSLSFQTYLRTYKVYKTQDLIISKSGDLQALVQQEIATWNEFYESLYEVISLNWDEHSGSAAGGLTSVSMNDVNTARQESLVLDSKSFDSKKKNNNNLNDELLAAQQKVVASIDHVKGHYAYYYTLDI